MLTIILGEDTAKSRKYWLEKKELVNKEGNKVVMLSIDNLKDILYNPQPTSLFFKKNIYFSENLLSKYLKKEPKLILQLETFFKERELFMWEKVARWELKVLKKIKTAKIVEFKPSKTIFNLLDLLSPAKMRLFIKALSEFEGDENFIFKMVIRRVRDLIIAKEGGRLKVQQWQLVRFQSQARLWDKDKLIKYYKNLFKIEKSVRVAETPLSLRESLELLSSYFITS